ncbi:MAG TPA: Rne/Rng family ribonuclease [Thermoanaerobaculia bacterium]|nr:Rne/Rng family ribonuclease [Thermoanaerobaculia bacterium]
MSVEGHKMLVESDPHQTRIAVLEDDRLTEIFVERHRHRGLVGNVYKGRVTRVLPGMQAAFVDVGLERDAFLYVSDVVESGSTVEELELDDEEVREAAASGDGQPSISDLLKGGQEIIVQVVKDPLPNKGARITTHVTLPGRYLVLLPTVRHVGVSRRIEDDAERSRLSTLVREMAEEKRLAEGLIVRTVGEDRGREEFEHDLEYLDALWARIRQRAGRAAAPALLHRDLDLALRVVRDLMSADLSVLLVDGEETYARIVEFLDEVHPELVGKVKLYQQDARLFEQFGIEQQIEAALESRVWLKSGGYIVINPTEALVAIDVNTGRFVGRTNLEDTVLQTNLEAVREIVRQIRLRDLGGIIVIDLIDMVEQAHRDEVFARLMEELGRDRAKTKVLTISEFGLVEITRKRSRANLDRLLTQPCPYCDGRGRIKSITTLCLELRKQILGGPRPANGGELLLRVHPAVAEALQREERAILDELEGTLGTRVLIQGDAGLHHEQFDVSEV